MANEAEHKYGLASAHLVRSRFNAIAVAVAQVIETIDETKPLVLDLRWKGTVFKLGASSLFCAYLVPTALYGLCASTRFFAMMLESWISWDFVLILKEFVHYGTEAGVHGLVGAIIFGSALFLMNKKVGPIASLDKVRIPLFLSFLLPFVYGIIKAWSIIDATLLHRFFSLATLVYFEHLAILFGLPALLGALAVTTTLIRYSKVYRLQAVELSDESNGGFKVISNSK